MLIGTERGQLKRGIVAHFLVPTCIVMNKNVFICIYWITLDVFELVSALPKLFKNSYHSKNLKNRFYQKSTDTVTVFINELVFCRIDARVYEVMDFRKFQK